MMGIKERNFQPLPDDLSLEVLVPKDNFYRRLEERIDLSFVRELVLPLYARGGRHSIDPVVFFKLQLVLFFEDLRSERQLMEVVADRLSLRWYVGYNLCEPLPDHSSLTKIRERYGLEIFRNFFERIVQMCLEAGLVRGKELFFDSTKVEADAAVDCLVPRWFVEAHLQDLFEEDDSHHESEEEPQGAEEFEDEESIHSLPTAGNEVLLRSNSPRAKTGSAGAANRIGPLAAAPEKEPPTPGPPRPTLTLPP
jgi:transposase